MHDSKYQFTITSLEPKTLKNLIIQGTQLLRSKKILNAKNEIEWFLQDIYQFNKIDLYNNSTLLISQKYDKIINNFLYKRSQGTPFQYLLKKAPFYGRDFIVNKNVLIPRPETEILINLIKDKNCKKLLDIGTGSGILAITAELENIAQHIDAIDIDFNTLSIAEQNCKKFNTQKVNLIKMDILKNSPDSKYDIIVSNPPYVSLTEYKKLDYQIQNYEPISSITDFKDGLTFYKRYAELLKQILKPRGIGVFEFSHIFKKEVIKKIFIDFKNIEFYNALNNDCRFVKISYD